MPIAKTGTTQSNSGEAMLEDYLGAFIKQLRASGLSYTGISRLRTQARHFLLWLDRHRISIGKVDHDVLRRFRRHDCRCPGMAGQRRKMVETNSRRFMTGALKLVRFLEQEGRIGHPGELVDNLNHLDAFLEHCAAQDYGTLRLSIYRGSCRHVLIWLHQSRIPLRDVSNEILDRFLNHDCVCPGSFEAPQRRLSRCSPRYEYPFTKFLRYLAERGVVSKPLDPSCADEDPVIEQFGAWLRQHRGIGESTVRHHIQLARSLKADLGPDPAEYTAGLIRTILLSRFTGASWHQARKLATAMRMYLRFLASSGHCTLAMVAAVPKAPVWALASLPRYVSAKTIEQLIGSCDTTKPVGVRDKAILLLLARLALRAGDIVALRFEDIDWRHALIRVCGKSRQEIRLPLPQDVGNAILTYVEHARPPVPRNRVFLRARAPYRPFASSGAVTSIVAHALDRAGMEDVRPRGAYLFRHSAATRLVRSGESLEMIGALLRHRGIDTTAIYAKVDRPMLLEVAQPWIGGGS